MVASEKIRNIAIVAHIDHGKTTLIDAIFRTAHVFRENAAVQERVMDSNYLERQRGITIRSKHCTVTWEDYLINIIDTPGHADFSGEVERVLSMVDSVLLLVDAKEGPMPQTRYVLMRALKRGMRPIVVVNKMDRAYADPPGVLDKTFDLFIELGANDEQADFPVLYGSATQGWMARTHEEEPPAGMDALFEAIVEEVPPPQVNREAPFRMQVSTLAWSDYIGQIGCGRVLQGTLAKGDSLIRTTARWKNNGGPEQQWEATGSEPAQAVHLWVTRGLERVEADHIVAGDIVWFAGPEEIGIGDTFSSEQLDNPALPPLEIEEPTVSMFFLANTGPFSGKEGTAITLRQLRERLERECRVNVALRVKPLEGANGVKVSGRGELHLAILIQEMRDEGMEFCVTRPEVITKADAKGRALEPLEQVLIDLPEEYQGGVIEKLAKRKGELQGMHGLGNGTMRLEYKAPTRGLIGFRSEFLTDTRGMGILTSRFLEYGPWRGDIQTRSRGSLVSMETGKATAYSLESLQRRAEMFVAPMDEVYAGMVVGENSRGEDLPCNPTKKKQMTNHRSATKEIDTGLAVPRKMSLEAALEWIEEDELVEVTPRSVRIRKAILCAEERKRAGRRQTLLAG